MVWKYINIGNAGNASLFGSDDMDKISKLLRGDSNVDNVDINSPWSFRSAKMKQMNVANTFGLTHKLATLTADRDVNWPALGANDEPLFAAHAAVVTGKTIDVINNTVKTRGNTLMTKSGSNYMAIKNDGTIISSSTVAETVLQAALDASGTLYFEPNIDWVFSGSFSGLTMESNCRILTDNLTDTYLIVPQGFSGVAITVGGASSNPAETVSIDGINIMEGGTPSKLWTAVKLAAVTDGSVFAATFKNMEIADALVAFELETTGTGFITNCVFRDITVFMGGDSLTGFLFDEQGDQISENRFDNINIETNSGPGWGFKNVDGTGNLFINCKVWDTTASGTEMNITSGASGTTIIGGRTSGGGAHFIDQGNKTLILDSGSIVNSKLNTSPDLCKFGYWDGHNSQSGNGIFQDNLSSVAVGTGSGTTTLNSTGIYREYRSGATNNSLIGMYSTAVLTERILNPYFKAAVYLEHNTNMRVFVGFVASASAPASASDPLNALEGVGLWLDTGVSANWKMMHNDSSGASTVDDTSVAAATSTLYPVEIYAVADTKFRLVFNGVSTDISSNIPASTTNLGIRTYLENTTGSDRRIRHYYTSLRTDK